MLAAADAVGDAGADGTGADGTGTSVATDGEPMLGTDAVWLGKTAGELGGMVAVEGAGSGVTTNLINYRDVAC